MLTTPSVPCYELVVMRCDSEIRENKTVRDEAWPDHHNQAIDKYVMSRMQYFSPEVFLHAARALSENPPSMWYYAIDWTDMNHIDQPDGITICSGAISPEDPDEIIAPYLGLEESE